MILTVLLERTVARLVPVHCSTVKQGREPIRFPYRGKSKEEHGDRAVSEAWKERFTILAVEDESAVRLVIADTLRDAGYNVVETTTATEAMVVLSSHRVQLVFSDVLMPGSIGGLTLAGWIKANRPKISVILCSGISAVSRYLHGREGVTFLEKPFGGDELLNVVPRIFAESTPRLNSGLRADRVVGYRCRREPHGT